MKIMTIVNGILFDVEIENKASRLVFPRTMQKIDKMAYESLNLLTSTLESIEVEEGNEYFHSKNNCLIETATKTLVLGCKNSIIPNDGSVEIIGEYAFNCCMGEKNIEIPEGVKEIHNMAFAYTDFEEILIPESIELIAEDCFALNPQLKSITIKSKNAFINDMAFGTILELYDFYQEEAYPANSDDLVIKAPKDSTAIAYAQRFGIKCEELV
ncbi:MAG: leucine-rich repeat domain-containing protein [Clostridia bacterium]|nr:leucine-rich repeat domain-containing protein [Clostridia bacterium]